MRKIIQKTGKVFLASAISLTALSFGSVGISNQAQAASQPPTSPSVPDNSDIKNIKVKYSASQVKSIDKKYSSPSGGAEAAVNEFAGIAASIAAPELGAAVSFANIGAAQWKSDYASHFKNAAENGTGLTITYKVDVNGQKLEGISFSA